MGFLYQWLWVRVLHGVPDSKPFEFDTFKTTNIGMDLAPHIELHTQGDPHAPIYIMFIRPTRSD